MAESPISEKRWAELELISKAFLHQIATNETTRRELLKVLPPPQFKPETPAAEMPNKRTLEETVADVVNRHLGLGKTGVAPLQASEMFAFDFEMQQRHSETATPGTFNHNSPGYSSTHPSGYGQGLGVDGSTSQPTGENSS